MEKQVGREKVKKMLIEKDKIFLVHEDITLYNNMSQLKQVILEFKKPNFQASDQCITHLLFMKRWEQNFNNTDIDKNSKKFIEDKVTPEFLN